MSTFAERLIGDQMTAFRGRGAEGEGGRERNIRKCQQDVNRITRGKKGGTANAKFSGRHNLNSMQCITSRARKVALKRGKKGVGAVVSNACEFTKPPTRTPFAPINGYAVILGREGANPGCEGNAIDKHRRPRCKRSKTIIILQTQDKKNPPIGAR